jgi:nicotinamide riboside transporter PnuC
MSWFAVGLSLTGNILINYQKRIGFVVWSTGNLFWIALALGRKDYAQMVLFGVYTLLNVHGYFTWKKGGC